jgi:hypothetical protein
LVPNCKPQRWLFPGKSLHRPITGHDVEMALIRIVHFPAA